jgi:hypothetical protein
MSPMSGVGLTMPKASGANVVAGLQGLTCGRQRPYRPDGAATAISGP